MEQLQKDLEALAPQKLSHSTVGLEDESLSRQVFVKPELLPKTINVSKIKCVSDEGTQEYSRKVLQAVYVIVSNMIAAIKSASIRTAFVYLDDTWVPKIVDNMTYQVGIKLVAFLKKALTEESFGIRDSIKKNLEQKFFILSNRIKNYEAHQPAEIQQSTVALTRIEERKKALEEGRQAFIKGLEEIEKKIKHLLKTPELRVEACEQDEKDFLALENKHNELKSEWAQCCEQWRRDNLKLKDIPEVVKVTPFIQALLKGEPELIKNEWLVILNTTGLLVEEEKTADVFSDYLQQMNANVSSQDEFFDECLPYYRKIFEDRVHDAKHLETVQRAFNQLVDAVKITELTEEALHLNQSEKPWSHQIGFYKAQIPALFKLQNQLAHDKGALEQQLRKIEGTVFKEHIKDVSHLKSFEEAQQAAKKQLENHLIKISVQLATVQDLIGKGTFQLHQLESDLAKKDTEARSKKDRDIRTRIQEKARLLVESKAHLNRATVTLGRYLKEVYQPAVTKDQDLAQQIETLQTQIQNATDRIKKIDEQRQELVTNEITRKAFLQTAKTLLDAFRALLLQHNGMYVPSQLIPKETLMQYLECSGDVREKINKMYKTEADSASWYGLNTTYLFNTMSHYTTFFGPSDFDEDINDLLDYLEQKKKLIDQELAVDIQSNEEDLSLVLNHSLMGKDNLWQMKTDFIAITAEQKALTEQLPEDKKWCAARIDDRKEGLPPVEKIKRAHEATCLAWSRNVKVDELAHQLALCELDAHKLQFLIADLDNDDEQLQEVIDQLEGFQCGEHALTDLNALVSKMNSMSVDERMKKKTSHFEPSGEELFESIFARLNQIKNTIGNELFTEALNSQMISIKNGLSLLQQQSETSGVLLAKLKQEIPSRIKIMNEKYKIVQLLDKLNQCKQLKEGLLQKAQGDEAFFLKEYEAQGNNSSEAIDSSDERVRALSQEILSLDKALKEKYLDIRREKIKNRAAGLQSRFFNASTAEDLKKDILAFKSQESDFIREHLGQDDVLTGLAEKEQVLETQQQLERIAQMYFKTEGHPAGVLKEYLNEREKTYWFKDLLSGIAAFTLGCFGYKTDAQLRQEYIGELNDAFSAYQSRQSLNAADSEPLLDVINRGLKQFPPRYHGEHSLFCKLSSLKSELKGVIEKLQPLVLSIK